MSLDSLPMAQRIAARLATAAWVALLVLAVSWESLLAPLRPGGSWLVLKALPLLMPLRGIVRGDVKAMQWVLLVLLYIGEGSVRLADASPVDMLATVELAFGALFFVAAIAYLRPFKLARRGRSR